MTASASDKENVRPAAAHAASPLSSHGARQRAGVASKAAAAKARRADALVKAIEAEAAFQLANLDASVAAAGDSVASVAAAGESVAEVARATAEASKEDVASAVARRKASDARRREADARHRCALEAAEARASA
eukprot:CAMPEP_0119274432 /NCGR_PEP_ID=MMETSP1329-20130426/12100_1 /TAXON_ID=114041 /ORGANISM="Genus nov. species nov., Strain RCC1024" /LENGTH=133 /DNA_ID=CAMNT_0007274747 /DNA_START=33 /DNA_END=430 /DNA_ORIENTATION=+